MNENIMKALEDNLNVDQVVEKILKEGDYLIDPENVFETIFCMYCGCGYYIEHNAMLMKKVFEFCNGKWKDSNFFEYFTEEEGQTAELILFIFTKYDLIEHGTAIRCPWFTNTGKLLYEALDKFEKLYEGKYKQMIEDLYITKYNPKKK